MSNFIKNAAKAYWARVNKIADYLESKELPQTAFSFKAATLLPLVALVSAPLSFLMLSALPITGLAMPLVAYVGLVTTASVVGMGSALTAFSFALEATANFVGKRQSKTITNEAGQTVTGSAFDLSRLEDVQKSVTHLSSAISAEQDAVRKERLSQSLARAFERAAPYAARVTVIKDPANENNTGYAFVKTSKTLTRETAA